jgi:hypothetical protein
MFVVGNDATCDSGRDGMKPPIGAQASANTLGGRPMSLILEPTVKQHARLPRQKLVHLRRLSGFTLVEVMVATAITLLIMAAVTALFANISASVQVSRASIELSDRIRSVKALLEQDLKGMTAVTVPPMRADDDKGYFEYVEGCVGPVIQAESLTGLFNPDGSPMMYPATHPLAGFQKSDTTVGDIDDIIMFTTRSWEQPFVGKSYSWSPGITNPAISSTAEICWFLRGTTLYRRVLLVLPNHQCTWATPSVSGTGGNQSYYALNDISARQINGSYDRVLLCGPLLTHTNALGDLTKRENRFGHQPHAFPHDVRLWGPLGLPTLQECSASGAVVSNTAANYYTWPLPMWDSGDTANGGGYGTVVGGTAGPNVAVQTGMGFIILPKGIPLPANSNFDAWQHALPWLSFNGSTGIDPASGNLQVPVQNTNILPFLNYTRGAEDLVMGNVLSFDVKVWDPGAPIFVDDNLNIAITPDDTKYVSEYLVKFINGNLEGWKHLVSFGTYVDLNYMCRTGFLPSNATSGYEAKLQQWEVQLGQSLGLGNALLFTQPRTLFGGPGNPRSGLAGQPPPLESGIPLPTLPNRGIAAIYDSGSDHYEQDGINQDIYFNPLNPWAFSNPYSPPAYGSSPIDTVVDEGTDGYDNDSVDPVNKPTVHQGTITAVSAGTSVYGESGVDDASEKEAPPPYPYALRGLQVKIRTFEPDSRQIVEVTIVQDFLP